MRRISLFVVLAIFVGMGARASEASDARTFYLTNIFGCTSDGSNVSCGPHLSMPEGQGNGTFPSGLIAVMDGAERLWLAPALAPDTVRFGTEEWTLRLGGSALIPGVRWSVGVYDPGTQVFTQAPGVETTMVGAGETSFAPAAGFDVAPSARLALRLRGSAGNGVPNLIDVHSETGGSSPSSLSVSDTPAELVPDASAQARDAACRADVSTDCDWRWLSRDDGPLHGPDAVTAAAVDPAGARLFVTGGSESTPRDQDFATIAYDVETGTRVWTARADGGMGAGDRPAAITVSPDGAMVVVTGVACASRSTINCGTNWDFLTMAYAASSGQLLWRATYAGPGGQLDEATAVAISQDGDTVVVGGQSWGGASNYDATIVAYDAASGAPRWVRRHAGSGDGADAVRALAVLGSRALVTGTVRAASDDLLVASYDLGTGTEQWAYRRDGPAGGPEMGTAIATTPTHVIVAGSETTGTGTTDAITLALDPATGALRWARARDGHWRGNDRVASLETSPDGTVVYAASHDHDGSVSSDVNTTAYAVASGATLWSQRWSGRGANRDMPQGLAVTPDGRGVALAITSFKGFSYATTDMVAVVLDAADGELRAVERYDGAAGDQDEARATAVTADRLLLTGTGTAVSSSIPTPFVDLDYVTLAYDLPTL